MRTIELNGVRFLVFRSYEDVDLYVKTERSRAFRAHRDELDRLRRDYLAGLQDSPGMGDDHHYKYMSAVKSQYESFAREIALLAKNEENLLVDPDLAAAPAS